MAITGEEIKKTRKRLDLSQETFAEKLGITRGLLNMIENGRRDVSKATEVLYMQFLGLQNVKNVSQETQKPVTDNDNELLEITRKYNKVLEERDNLKSTVDLLVEKDQDHTAKILVLMRSVAELQGLLHKRSPKDELEALNKKVASVRKGTLNKSSSPKESAYKMSKPKETQG